MRNLVKAKSIEAPVMAEPADDLAGNIAGAMRGMHDLREKNAALSEQLSACERDCAMLESEVATLKIQLDSERSERRHYHSLANEIITRLDVVGRTVDDVVQRAHREVQRQRQDMPHAEVPELQIPAFLRPDEAPPTSEQEAA